MVAVDPKKPTIVKLHIAMTTWLRATERNALGGN